jgi:hypothetical protein
VRFSAQGLKIHVLSRPSISMNIWRHLVQLCLAHLGSSRGISLAQPVLCIFNACAENSCWLLLCNFTLAIAKPPSNLKSGQEKTCF